MNSNNDYMQTVNKVSARGSVDWKLLKEFFEDAFDEVLKSDPRAVVLFRTKIVKPAKRFGMSIVVRDFNKDWPKVEKVLLGRFNVPERMDVYFVMTALDDEKLNEKAGYPDFVVENAHRDAIDLSRLLVLDVDLDELVLSDKVVFSHKQHLIDVDKIIEIQDAKVGIAKKVTSFLVRAGAKVYAVFDTGGGVQVWVIFKDAQPVGEVLSLGSKLVVAVNHYLKQELPEEVLKAQADDIYVWPEHIVRVPLTLNWGYKDANGKPVPLEGRILRADREFTDFKKLKEFIDEYITEHNIPDTRNKRVAHSKIDVELKRRELTKIMYKINDVPVDELTASLVGRLISVFEDINSKGYSRHDFWLALAGFFVKYTDISAEKLVELATSIFNKLVEAGVEDPSDWNNRLKCVRDTISKYNAGENIASIKYLIEAATAKNYSEIDARSYFNDVHKALRKWRVREVEYSKRVIKSTNFDELDEETKKYVATWYLSRFLLSGWDYIKFSKFSLSFVWEHSDSFINTEKLRELSNGDMKKYRELFRQEQELARSKVDQLATSMLRVLGFEDLDADTAVELEEFQTALVERELVDYGLLKTLVFEGVVGILKGSSVIRVPPCILTIVKRIVFDNSVSMEEWKHLLVFIKNYVRITPPILLNVEYGADARLYLPFVLVSWFIDEDTKDEIIRVAKSVIGSDVEFKCAGEDMKRQCPLEGKLGLSRREVRSCPFIYPDEDDYIVLLIREAVFYKDTKKLELVLLRGKRISVSLDKDSIGFVKKTKSGVRYPLAEVVLRALALEGITLYEEQGNVLRRITELLRTKLKTKYEFDLSLEFREFLAKFVERGDVLDDFKEYTSTKVAKLIRDERYYYIPAVIINRFREYLEEEGLSISKKDLRDALFAKIAVKDFQKVYRSVEGNQVHVRGIRVERKFVDEFLQSKSTSSVVEREDRLDAGMGESEPTSIQKSDDVVHSPSPLAGAVVADHVLREVDEFFSQSGG